jgi:hypothetical protein
VTPSASPRAASKRRSNVNSSSMAMGYSKRRTSH